MILHQLVKDTQTHTLNNVYKHPILNRHIPYITKCFLSYRHTAFIHATAGSYQQPVTRSSFISCLQVRYWKMLSTTTAIQQLW